MRCGLVHRHGRSKQHGLGTSLVRSRGPYKWGRSPTRAPAQHGETDAENRRRSLRTDGEKKATVLATSLQLRPRVRAAAVHVGLIAAWLELRALGIVGHLGQLVRRRGHSGARAGTQVMNRRRGFGNLGLGAEIYAGGRDLCWGQRLCLSRLGSIAHGGLGPDSGQTLGASVAQVGLA